MNMQPRATLLYNSEAGFETYSPDMLINLLRQSGFAAEYKDSKDEDLALLLKNPGELVVAGGGDGTIGAIARELVNRDIPLGILPLGTANNIAKSLGIRGTPEDIIPTWDLSRKKYFDVGVVQSPAGTSYFLESIGFGLFPSLIREREGASKSVQTREEELEDALKHQLEIVSRYTSQSCTLRMDGNLFTDTYLMVEIMNTPLAGPNLVLAPKAEHDDGEFDVTLVREHDRASFSEFITQSLRNCGGDHGFPVHRAKKLEITWQGEHYHSDDKPFTGASPVTLTISMLPRALQFLHTGS